MNQAPGTEALEVTTPYRFPGYSIFVRPDNIVELHYDNGFNCYAEDARHIISFIKKTKGNAKPSLLVVCSEDNTFDKDAREYVASKAVSAILKADAVVINSLPLKIVLNGYIKINKPNRPTRLFNCRIEALKWLKQIP